MHRLAVLLVWAAALPALVFAQGQNPPPDSFITLQGQADSQLFAVASAFGSDPSKFPGSQFDLVSAPGPDPLGCNSVGAAPNRAEGQPPFAALIPRGNCTFSTKVRNAQQAGFAAAVVFDSVTGAYPASMLNNNANGSALYGNACSYDCSQGSALVSASVATLPQVLTGFPGQCGSSCGTGACILTASTDVPLGQRQLCCMVGSNTLEMGGSGSGISIPSVFVDFSIGQTLQASIASLPQNAPPTITLGLRSLPSVDQSTILLVLLGVGVVVLVSWRSAEVERERLFDARAEDVARRIHGDDAEAAARAAAERRRRREEAIRRRVVQERVQLTFREGLFMLIIASAVLITLFFLVRAGVPIIYFVIVIFSLGSLQALYLLVFYPFFRSEKLLHCGSLGRKLDTNAVIDRTVRNTRFYCSYASFLAGVISLVLVAVWLATRNQSGSWILQDAFGVALCCLFLLQLQINKLRDATIVLCAFFAYDIFAVLIAPFVFGSSPMIDVATAGQPSLPPSGSPWDIACYCRLNPQDSAVCGKGEYMPLLFRLPRYNDYRGGYSMLGFGDIVIPGLLVSLCLRFDLALKVAELQPGEDAILSRRLSAAAQSGNILVRNISYWAACLVGYTIGLVLAMVAVTVFASGQPALLYLVPCTVGPIVALSYYRGDWRLWWLWGGIDAAQVAATAAAAGVSDGAGGGATATLTAEEPLEVTVADVNVALPPNAAAGSTTAAATDLGAYAAIDIDSNSSSSSSSSSHEGAPDIGGEGPALVPSQPPEVVIAARHGEAPDGEDEEVPLTSEAAKNKD